MSLIMHKIAKTAVSAAIALSLVASALVPMSTSASAGDWRGRNGYYDGRSSYRYDPPRAYHYDAPRRHNNGSRIAKGVAIGIGAAVIGAIIADSARRARAEQYEQYEQYD